MKVKNFIGLVGLFGLVGVMVCGCSTATSHYGESTFVSGEKIRFEPDDSFPEEYRHRITETLTRHGFEIVSDKESTPLSCTAEFNGGVGSCAAYIFVRRDGHPLIKVRSQNHGWRPMARSAQEMRIKAAIEKFDEELGHVQKKLD